jgi:hypothetical protein
VLQRRLVVRLCIATSSRPTSSSPAPPPPTSWRASRPAQRRPCCRAPCDHPHNSAAHRAGFTSTHAITDTTRSAPHARAHAPASRPGVTPSGLPRRLRCLASDGRRARRAGAARHAWTVPCRAVRCHATPRATPARAPRPPRPGALADDRGHPLLPRARAHPRRALRAKVRRLEPGRAPPHSNVPHLTLYRTLSVACHDPATPRPRQACSCTSCSPWRSPSRRGRFPSSRGGSPTRRAPCRDMPRAAVAFRIAHRRSAVCCPLVRRSPRRRATATRSCCRRCGCASPRSRDDAARRPPLPDSTTAATLAAATLVTSAPHPPRHCRHDRPPSPRPHPGLTPASPRPAPQAGALLHLPACSEWRRHYAARRLRTAADKCDARPTPPSGPRRPPRAPSPHLPRRRPSPTPRHPACRVGTSLRRCTSLPPSSAPCPRAPSTWSGRSSRGSRPPAGGAAGAAAEVAEAVAAAAFPCLRWLVRRPHSPS